MVDLIRLNIGAEHNDGSDNGGQKQRAEKVATEAELPSFTYHGDQQTKPKVHTYNDNHKKSS